MTTSVLSPTPPDISRSDRRFLDVFFAPETVAVFGATERRTVPGAPSCRT